MHTYLNLHIYKELKSLYDDVIFTDYDFFDQWDPSTRISMQKCVDDKEDYVEK